MATILERISKARRETRALRDEILAMPRASAPTASPGVGMDQALEELRRLRTLYESDDPLMTPELQQ